MGHTTIVYVLFFKVGQKLLKKHFEILYISWYENRLFYSTDGGHLYPNLKADLAHLFEEVGPLGL